MPGVNRSNVAVTDTFDTWRIRTNELNTSLNLGTNAITGNTVVWRDDDGSFTANVTTINTIAVTHNTTTTALTVTSALAAADDGSKASIVTTGGVLAALKSRFQDEVFVEGKLTTNSHAEFGDSAADTVEFNSTLVGDIVPNSNVASDLGSSTMVYDNIWAEHGYYRANTTFTGSVIDMVSTSDAGANGINIIADSEDTGFGINVQMNALTSGGLFKVSSTSADDTARNLGTIHTNHASAPGTTGLLVQAESGRGVFIDTNLAAGGYALEIDAQQQTSNTAKIDSAATSGTMLELSASGILTGKGVDITADAATTGSGLFMSMDALTTGKMMDLTSTSTSTGTRSLVKITNDAVEAVGVTAFEIDSDAGRGIYVNSGLAASLPSLEITSALATTNTAIITADSTTDGTVFQLSADALEDGRALDISSTSTDTSARRLVSITNDAAAATGTDALYIQSDAGKGIYVTSTLAAGGPSLDILSAHETTDAINVVANSLTTGGVLDISSSSTATNPRALATITQSGDVTTSGDTTGLKLAMTSGRGLFIDSDDANGAPAFEIDSEHATTNAVTLNATTTTATGMDMAFGALTTGTGLDIRGTGAGMSTAGSLVEIQQTNALSSAANVATLSVMTAGNGAYGVKINSSHATSNASLRIDSTTTTKNIVEVVGNALTSGDGMQVSSSAAHTGQLISLSSTATGDTARGEALHIQYNTANTSALAMKIANSSATSFSVSQAGDVVMGGNLSVLGTTTQINTTTTVARDTAIVLGAQSEIVTGATYTAANPPVVTSPGHTLDNGQIIFVVASSGTAIVSEQLVKVSANGTNVFTPTTIADVAIAASGDSTTRTFSWTGPQTDAAVDDAGLIVPGDTAIHSIKWDDTDNYWELNDSTMINSTGQFVFPKGTSAQQPASSASATLAAATPGAQRYNTTNSKFEGVTTGTTWENMSSEAFAVAVSIALG